MTTATFEVSSSATTAATTRVPAWLWSAATAAVLGAAYGPMMWEFGVNQWARPHYQYFPFVLAAFAWLLWRNSRVAEPVTPERPDQGLAAGALLIVAWILLAMAYRVESPWLAAISAILMVANQFVHLSRKWRVEYLWGIWAILWLIVPLPLARDQQLITALQHLSSRLSSSLLDSVGVEHLMEGNALLLPSKHFFIDEACSGIVSVLAVIACAAIYGIWRNRPPAHVVILALAGVGWATVLNVVRITTVAVAFDKRGIDWSTGTEHEILGLVIFTFIAVGLVSTDMLLLALLTPIGQTWAKMAGAPARFGKAIIRAWDRMFAPRQRVEHRGNSLVSSIGNLPLRISRIRLPLIPLAAFALLAALQFGRFSTVQNAAAAPPAETQAQLERALACGSQTLPSVVGGLRRVKFVPQTRQRNDAFGAFSRTYEYRDDDGTVYVASCDFPYHTGWHELTVCYRGIGWELNSRRLGDQQSELKGMPWEHLEADFSKPDGAQGFLLASAFDHTGLPLELPSASFSEDLLRALTNRRGPTAGQSVFQVQVWTTAIRPITDRERDAARKLLVVARQRFYDHIAATNGAAPSQHDANQQPREATLRSQSMK